jgi:hypothetical protein
MIFLEAAEPGRWESASDRIFLHFIEFFNRIRRLFISLGNRTSSHSERILMHEDLVFSKVTLKLSACLRVHLLGSISLQAEFELRGSGFGRGFIAVKAAGIPCVRVLGRVSES